MLRSASKLVPPGRTAIRAPATRSAAAPVVQGRGATVGNSGGIPFAFRLADAPLLPRPGHGPVQMKTPPGTPAPEGAKEEEKKEAKPATSGGPTPAGKPPEGGTPQKEGEVPLKNVSPVPGRDSLPELVRVFTRNKDGRDGHPKLADKAAIFSLEGDPARNAFESMIDSPPQSVGTDPAEPKDTLFSWGVDPHYSVQCHVHPGDILGSAWALNLGAGETGKIGGAYPLKSLPAGRKKRILEKLKGHLSHASAIGAVEPKGPPPPPPAATAGK